nr:acyl-CoA thioester hydrolase/BAAT C-terminal domain-containing protein [Marinicella sp. NBU2979]
MAHSQNPQIDPHKLILIGGSKGGELVLNLASRYPDYQAVVALVPSHVSFPGLTFNMDHSSWTHQGKEVPFVKATPKIVGPRMTGDLHQVFTLMLEDVDDRHEALIPVEKINGSVLLISAQHDEVWPSTLMSEKVILRLQQKSFQHPHAHWPIDGDHASVLDQFPQIIAHLKAQFIH